MSLIETEIGSNAPEFSVSEISLALKRTVEENFSYVRVRGELGRVTRASSGHVYVDLKDDKAVINCNIWRPIVERLDFVPVEGMEVIATGKISTYAPRSGYNLIIERLEIAGEGALMALLEKRKKALAAEGLFDADRKKPLPYLPEKIGVITSRTGAVIRDILHRLEDRFPREVLLWPVAVQGKGSAEEVVAAIRGFNELPEGHPLRPDVIIVARGGGSIEDLWGFNEEIVVRAVAASTIPVISAVGHETDTTLIDYVSDLRAPTPTAAAELVVPVRVDLLAHIANLDARLRRAMQKERDNATRRLTDLARALPRPSALLALPAQRFDLASSRLESALRRQISSAKENFARVSQGFSLREFLSAVNAKSQNLAHISSRLAPAYQRQMESARTRLQNQSRLLDNALIMQVRRAKDRFVRASQGFQARLTSSAFAMKSQNLAFVSARLQPAYQRQIERARTRLQNQSRLLDAYSYTHILDRGFALILDQEGKLLKSAQETRKANDVTIRQKDGETKAKIGD